MKARQFISMLLVMLGSVTGAMSQNNVLRYTATEDLFDYFYRIGRITSHEYNSETHEGLVTYASDVTTIPMDAFTRCSSLTSIDLPASLTSIGDYAFEGCSSLTAIDIPANVTEIPQGVFFECYSLMSVTINSQQTLNAMGGFIFCNIEEYLLRGNITTIPFGKFYYDYNLKKITLPTTLVSIEELAFYGCENLESIYCLATTPPAINATVFQGIELNSVTLKVPSGCAGLYQSAKEWSEFTNIQEFPYFDLSDNDSYYSARDFLAAPLTYSRTFTVSQANKWQALFVPFDITIDEELLGKCDIAKPYMVSTKGSLGGIVDEDDTDVVVLKKLKDGDTAKHGTAYFIRPKVAGEIRLEYANATVCASTNVTTLTCSTTEDDYAFVGQYTEGKPTSGTWYALSGGNFKLGGNSSPNLSAQRWYMTKTRKSSSASAAAKAITLLTLGEDSEATAIVAAQADKSASAVIYSPTGVRLSQPQKGLNIIGGKKVIIK